MPELPEARTIARRLHEAVAGCAITTVRLLRPDMLKTGAPGELESLAGADIDRVDTRGKYVILHTSPARLVIQLGMAGRVKLARADEPREPHSHLELSLGCGRVIRYSNTRRIASGLHVLPPGTANLGPLSALGPEATEVSQEAFREALQGRRRAVKAALLDQSLLAGLGNIYTDEALSLAGIRPRRRADKLTRDDLARLHDAVRIVLSQAIDAGGSTLADANPFVDADGSVGYFAARHRVYGRGGRPCHGCRTELKRIVVAGRTSVYCPRCQK